MKRLFLLLLTLFMIIGVQAQRPSVKEQMEIKQYYMNFCKDLNQQLPIQVDDYTKFYAISFVNWTLTAYYQLDVDSDDFSENELIELHGELRSAFKESARRMFDSGNYDLKRDEWKWFNYSVKCTRFKVSIHPRHKLNKVWMRCIEFNIYRITNSIKHISA